MNVSAANVTMVLDYRDPFTKAVIKNVIVSLTVALFIISYILYKIQVFVCCILMLIALFTTENTPLNLACMAVECYIAVCIPLRHAQICTIKRTRLLISLIWTTSLLSVTLAISLFMVSYTIYKVHVSVCCILVLLTLFTNESTPLNLACMVMECYITICMPLRHVQTCTVKRTLMLVGLIWATSLLSVLPDLFITLATEPLDFFHSQVFYIRQTAFPNVLLVKKRDITYSVFLVLLWFVIFLSNFKIQFTAKTASKDATKARNTVVLHGFQVVLCMTTYAAPLLKNVPQKSFALNYNDSLFAFYIIVQVMPRSISPIIFGVRDMFRKYLKRYVSCKFSEKPFRTLRAFS
ncbi:hypothetical protein XENOCAPTIV_013281 [Xenoophorus captivus]|uniref:G-protein coupled receptors family 1 profile domain-containing protein n=1 Tax=Xenoophorus captivus TaxID=1517983 RepID=A0ABV0QRM4_9TELE